MAEPQLPRVAVAQLGARRHYAVPRILHEAGMLERFFTDSYSGDKPVLRRVVAGLDRVRPSDAARRWLSRRADDLPPDKVTSFERLGWRFATARQRRGGRSDPMPAAAAALNHAIVRQGLGEADTIFAFNGAALELFEHGRRHSLRCILDQTLAARRVYRQLMLNERAQWPDWQRGFTVPDEGDERTIREETEWRYADRILCPSQFVVDSIAEAGGPVEKCLLVPYGTDDSRFPRRSAHHCPEARPLRVLFAGEVGLRKGAPYLLEALRRLGPELVQGRFVGRLALEPGKLTPYAAVASFTGSLPRPEMRAQFAWADVFAFPSVCEGSAAVLSEALASGLPVVCTSNSGPPPCVDGLQVVPFGDIDALVATLSDVHRDPGRFRPREDLDPPFGLGAYGRRLRGAVGPASPGVRDAAMPSVVLSSAGPRPSGAQ